MPVTKKSKKSTNEVAQEPSRSRSKSKSPAKPIQSKSAPKAKRAAKKSQSQTRAKSTPKKISVKEEKKILYQADTHAAVLDQDSEKDDEEVFWIIKILEDVKEGDEEVECDLFKPEGETMDRFKIETTTTTIMAADVIMEITPQILKSRSKDQPPSVLKMKKLQINQVQKLQKSILENRHAKEDAEANDDEPVSKSTQNKSKVQPDRKIKKIVGVKKSLPPAAEPVQSQRQLRARKQPEPVKVKDQDMEESQARRSTSKTNKRTKKTEPVAGKKRRRGGSEESDSSDDGDEERLPKDEESQPAGEKRRRVQVGKKEVIESIPQTKVKKEKPKPTEYKRGVWNPDIEIIEYEHEKEAKDTKILSDCCKRCAGRSFHRAAMTQNAKLLADCIKQTQAFSSLNLGWSPDVHTTAIEIVARSGNLKLLETVMRPPVTQQIGEDYDQALTKLLQKRAMDEPYLMQIVETGKVSHMAYGTAVRSVAMTRGNRQGNNAFLQDQSFTGLYIHMFNYPELLNRLMLTNSLTVEFFKALEKLRPMGFKQGIAYQIYNIIRMGNYKLAEYLVKDLSKQPNYGYNDLHANVLGKLAKGSKLPEFKSVSIGKKATTCLSITPLHFACINPNVEVLAQLLAVNSDVNITDQQMMKPIHYAAACESVEPLKLLLSKGANIQDIDNTKTTCLHMAIKAGRPKNAKFILETFNGLIKLRDRPGMTAMAYACKNDDIECIKVLIQQGQKVNQGVGKDRMMPLGWAAALGNYKLCEWLLDNKARIISTDKFKRAPLIMAVRNGHLKVATLLLQRGADWMQADSSSNTPLHYAAAYGWPEMIDLLIKIGADINAENSWRATPINIAMLKNHEGCVKKFLEYPGVDVNKKDDKGRTLLTLALLDLTPRTVDFVKFLLNKGAEPNLVDTDGQGSLHYLANQDPHAIYDNWAYMHRLGNDEQKINDEIQARIKVQLQLADLLLANNASRSIMDSKKRTPFALCLERDNIELLNKLMESVSLNNDPGLLHTLASKILNKKYQKILHHLIQNDLPSEQTINVLDEEGFTPFLAYIKDFCTTYPAKRGQMMEIINTKAAKHGSNVQLFKADLTNAALFERPKPQQNRFNRGFGYQHNQVPEQVHQAALSIEQKNKLTDELMETEVIQPFLECMKFLVEKGANPHAQVQKLKEFRELEEKRRLLLQAGQNAQQEGAIAKRREEVLIERKLEEKLENKKKAPKKKAVGGKGVPNYAVDKAEPKKKVESEYHATMGLQNAFHISITFPHPHLIDFLQSVKVNPDLEDHKTVTPFNLLSTAAVHDFGHFEKAFEKLVSLGVRKDLPDQKGRTPFLNYYERTNLRKAHQLLDMGANVDQMDASGLSAMKYAVIRRSSAELTKLVSTHGAKINNIDHQGRNLLHHAVNLSSATADATFEIEQILIELGVDINCRDQNRRTPLHYAFVKIGQHENNTQIDPIETVSSLCGRQGLEVHVADKWEKTPLHYASQRGASICAMYLCKRGANLEAIDIYGNTPLGTALLSHHHNFGIIMIQKNANVLKLVNQEDPKRIEAQWKKEAEERGISLNDDAEMEDQEEDDDRKHRHLFDKNNTKNNFYGSDDDYDSENYYSDDDSDDQHEQNVFANQNAFGFNPYQNQQQLNNQFGAFGNNRFHAAKKATKKATYGVPNQPLASQAADPSKWDGPRSMFRLAISQGQLGLAYLMLDQGYSLMLAMQDALDEKKFQLVITLIQKCADDSVVQAKNTKGQNLFHVLCQNAKGCPTEHLKRIYNEFQKRGIDCLEADGVKRTALHYAVQSGIEELVILLLQQRASPLSLDEFGHTPMTLYLRGKKAAESLHLYDPQTGYFDPIFKQLCEHGGQMITLYPESDFEPAYKNQKELLLNQGIYEGENYKTTVLLNLVRQMVGKSDEAAQKRLRNAVLGMMNYGASLDVLDSDGRDVMSYAILHNNLSFVEFLCANKFEGGLKNTVKDVAGKTAAHLAVVPLPFGSYENRAILQKLSAAGFQMDSQDSQGKTPLDYASLQGTGVLFKELCKLLGRPQDLPKRRDSGITIQSWPSKQTIDFEKDSNLYLESAREEEERKMKDDDEKKELVPVDPNVQEKCYRVFCEELKPWDAYLSKVDLRNGIYGDYVFYKMQLLHDHVRDLYVVLTRWGRIGENGMNQRSPFNNIDEAKKEFCTIFKQKSGNDFTDLDNFQKVKKKYNLAKVNYVTVAHQDYLAPFDYKKCPDSNLEKNTRKLLEEITNITMYQRAIKQMGFDTQMIPISGLSKQTIVKAQEILAQLREKVQQDADIAKKGLGADLDALLQVREEVSELTSLYYELIPLSRYKDQIAPPINHMNQIKEQFDALSTLTNIEYASKLLLGALHRQNSMNPVDYVHNVLNLQLQYLETKDPEYDIISQYVKNTDNPQGQGGINYDTHQVKVFKIQRKGEMEANEVFKNLKNKRLLFHGSQLSNYMGILSQGLRIAPPEAPTTGYMFGKGVYFADMFSKSRQYAHSYDVNSDSNLLLLCEVALGQSKELRQPEYVEKLDTSFQSVHGIGNRGPDYDKSVYLPNGIEVPLGPVIEYKKPKVQQIQQPGFNFGLQQQIGCLGHNEFIVYNTQQIRMRYLIQVVRKPKKELRAE